MKQHLPPCVLEAGRSLGSPAQSLRAWRCSLHRLTQKGLDGTLRIGRKRGPFRSDKVRSVYSRWDWARRSTRERPPDARKMPTLLVIILLFVGTLACGESGPAAAQDPIISPSHQAPAPYPVLIAPGLVPSRTPQQVVGTVPGPFGGGLSGQVSEVEQVAFIRTCQLPLIDPRVSPPQEHPTVWYVRFSGTFPLNVLGYVDQPPNHEAYYLVSDRTGAVLQSGTFSPGSADPSTPDRSRLTLIRHCRPSEGGGGGWAEAK